MSTESLSGQQLEQPLELEQEADGAAANGDGEPPLAKTSSKYKKKTKGEIIRENMPDKLMPRLIKWIQHLFTTFGRDVVIVMCMVYVMQGARTAFLYLAIDYACMDPNVGLGVSAGQAAMIKATAYLPWSFKPFYGITADLVPLRGSHRKNWLMLISILGGSVAMSMYFIDPGSDNAQLLFVTAITINNLCVAICDVLADAMVAEYAKLEKGHGAGNLQVAVFGSNNMGQILLNFFAGDVLEWVGPWPMFVCFGILQAGIAGIAMILNETPDEEEVTWPKVKRQLTLLKKTLVYPPIYMPAIFFYLINGGRPDITNGILQYITDQDDGYGIDIDPYFFNGNIASDFGLPDRDLANVDPDSELAAAPVPSSRWVDVSGGPAQGAPTYDATNWIGCDTFFNFDLGCNGAWLKEMEDKSAAAGHPSGLTFGVEIAGSERMIYVPEGYSFNYNLVDDDEQAQKPDESFSDYQIRLLGLVSTTLNSGNIRSYYNGIDGDDAKDDTRPKGHIFTLVPTLGADGQPTDGPSCSAAAGDVCRTIFTPNGVCGGDGTSCGASLLAEAYRTCPMACQECQYEGGGNGATGVGVIKADSPHRGCIGFSPKFISRSQLPGNFLGLLAQNLFAAYFIDTPIRKLIFGCNVILFLTTFFDLAMVSGFYTYFGIGPAIFYIMGDRSISYFCGWLGWLPMATLAAQICPPSVEATLFGLLMSCLNLGTSTSAYWGHWLMESSGVSQTQFGGMVTAQYALVISRAIIPFLVLIFVPKGNPTEMTDEFERQNKHLLGEKTSGLVTSDSKKSMNGGGHSNGSANGAPPTEPDAPPPGQHGEATAL